jgi:argininosuccinate synthase
MSREDAIAFAAERGVPVPVKKSSPYSIDENLWGRSIECGALEDPWAAPPEDAYALTKAPESASDFTDVEVSFEKGLPVSVGGEGLSVANALAALGKVAGEYGFGRVDLIEDRLVGIKSREVYEAPAALALIAAHRDLEDLVSERAWLREKRRLETKWAEVVYEGLWFSPLREAIEDFARVGTPATTGDVRLRFSPGSCRVIGRRSPHSLYDDHLATYTSADSFDHSSAAGFIKLWGLPAVQWSKTRHRSDG